MKTARSRVFVAFSACAFAGIGCNPQATSFESGTGETSLDGAVIEHEGSDFALSMDDQRQALARVDIDNGSRFIEFDLALSERAGVPVPRTIATAQNQLDINVQSGVASLTVDVPFAGEQTFEFRVDDGLALLGLEGRVVLQNRDGGQCGEQVAGIDEFCEIFQANADEAMQMVVDLALGYVKDNGLSPALSGTVEGIVREFFDVMSDFCDAWTTVRDGDGEALPVDPCNATTELD